MVLSLDSINPKQKVFYNILIRTLHDIINNIEIDDRFAIHHPQYNSIELDPEIKNRFFKLPEIIKINYLKNKIQSFIFQHYYNQPKPLFLNEQKLTGDRLSSITTNVQDHKIENNTFKWSKTKFYRDLCHFNRGRGYFESGWLVIGKNEEGLIKVRKNDLIIHIDPKHHLETTKQLAQIGDLVSVKMPPHYVELGYYIAISNSGSIHNLELEPNSKFVEIYFNINSAGALFFLDKITTKFNQLELLFNFKTLYRPEDYVISDSAILSVDRQDYNLVIPFIEGLYQTNASYFQPEIPLFTKYLAPGLSLAEIPISPERKLENFGINRCQIIAIALIKAWQSNITSAEKKLEYIINAFNNAGIALEQPYLNPGSKDIYD